jgi:hypothetical protein
MAVRRRSGLVALAVLALALAGVASGYPTVGPAPGIANAPVSTAGVPWATGAPEPVTDAPGLATGASIPDEPPPERWNRTYGAAAGDFNDVAVTDEGAVLAAGTVVSSDGTDGYVVRTGSDGAERWNRTYGDAGDDVIRAVHATGDGGAVLAGSTSSGDGDGSDGWVVGIGPDGTVQWEFVAGGTGSDRFAAIAPRDGGYLVAGTRTLSTRGDADGWLVRLSADGNLQATETYNQGTEDAFTDVARTPSGYVLVGKTTVPPDRTPDGWVVAVAPNGTEQWRQQYGGDAPDEFHAVAANGTALRLVGTTAAAGRSERAGWLLAATGNGSREWQRTYEGASLAAVAAGPDSGHLLVGETRPASGLEDGLVAGVTADGRLQWRRTAGGSNFDSFAAVARSPDGGYALAGTSGSYGDAGTGWLRKLGGTVTPSPTAAGTDATTTARSGTDTASGPPTDETPAGSATPGGGDTATGTGTTPAGSGALPVVVLLAVLGVVLIAGTVLAVVRFGSDRIDSLPDGDEEGPVPGLDDLLGSGSTAPGGGSDADVPGEAAGTAASDDPAPGDVTSGTATDTAGGNGAAGATPGSTAGSGAAGGSLPDMPGEAGPGTFTITNAGAEPVVCRFRCQTRDGVEFDHWVELEPGATRRAHALPTERPFQIGIMIEDGAVDSRVFLNDGPAGDDVLVRIDGDDSSIEPDEG